MVRPIEVEGQRASALRFGDRRIQALFSVLVLFTRQARGFTHSDLRALLAPLLGLDPAHYPQGTISYDLRRLRLHRIIERFRTAIVYQLTTLGSRVALFFSRAYARLLRPMLAEIAPNASLGHSLIRVAFERLQTLMDQACREAQLATV